MTEAPETIVGLLNANWNTSNHTPKPVIDEIWDVSSTNVLNSEYVLVYLASLNHEYNTIEHGTRDTRAVVRIDLRSSKRGDPTTTSGVVSLKEEVERILHSVSKSVGSGWDWLKVISHVDLTDKSKQLYRQVLEVELNKIGENV